MSSPPQNWAQHLARWQAAGLIDTATAERIETFEAADERPAGQRWQVLVALLLGALLLGAGVLLFVAAHWDQISPLTRFALVLAMLAAFHLAALSVAEKFPALATALHGVGTISAGAAIAMLGQIFNMQEHWPAAILLWAACAAAGWYWLRDQFQLVCLLLLAPAWLVCEWAYRADPYRGSTVYGARMIAVLAAVYLTAFVHSRQRAVRGMLFSVAAVALPVTTVVLAEGWGSGWRPMLNLPLSLRATAIGLMALFVLAAFVWHRRSVVPVAAVLLATFALPWLRIKIGQDSPPLPSGRSCMSDCTYAHWEPSVFLYALIAVVALLFCWHGLRERSKTLVNYGIAMFALTVGWFYFSSIMDKLGRSLGLIGLGVLFLAGGWLLEHLRRKVLLQMQTEPIA